MACDIMKDYALTVRSKWMSVELLNFLKTTGITPDNVEEVTRQINEMMRSLSDQNPAELIESYDGKRSRSHTFYDGKHGSIRRVC